MRSSPYSVLLFAPVQAFVLEVVFPFTVGFGLVVGVGAWWFGRRTRGRR